MTKQRRKKNERVEWKLHDELAQAINSLDFVEVWAGATTATQVRVQLRIANWDRWLSVVRSLRIAEVRRAANLWNLHVCEEFVLRPGTEELVVTWHLVVKAADNLSAVKQVCDVIAVAGKEPALQKGPVKKRSLKLGEIGPGGVMSYPFAGIEGDDRNIPVNGRGVVKTDPGKVK